MATYSTTNAPLPWMEPYMQDFMSRAQEVANTPYQQGPGTYTGPNELLQSGWQMTANRAMQGSPEMSAARGQLTNTINGQFLGRQAMQNQNAGSMNPYMNAGNPYASQMNPFAGVRNEAANVANPYAQMNNPYLNSAIDNAQSDLARNYNLVNKPAWDKAMQSSGSFGNTGVAEMAANDRNNLMQNMGRIGTDMRMGAYNQAANLNESQVGRQFSAGNQLQQNLYGAGNQQAQNLYGFGNQQMQNQFSAGNQFAQNQFNAGADYAGRQDAIGNLERGYQQSAMGMAPAFANQDYTDINNLMNAGGMQQQFNQQYQNQQNQFFNDARLYPQQQLAFYGQNLGLNTGGTSTQNAPDPSTASQLLGGGLTGAAIYKMLGLGD